MSVDPCLPATACRLRSVPNSVNLALLSALNTRGDMFFIHTELGGRTAIRMAIGNPGTQLSHVVSTWTAIQQAAGHVLLQPATPVPS